VFGRVVLLRVECANVPSAPMRNRPVRNRDIAGIDARGAVTAEAPCGNHIGIRSDAGVGRGLRKRRAGGPRANTAFAMREYEPTNLRRVSSASVTRTSRPPSRRDRGKGARDPADRRMRRAANVPGATILKRENAKEWGEESQNAPPPG
jgi:hypothetical protein